MTLDEIKQRTREIEIEINFHINRIQSLVTKDFGVTLFIFHEDEGEVASIWSTRDEKPTLKAMKGFIKRGNKNAKK